MMDEETLWYIALNGSPMASAFALAMLDDLLNGQILELKRRIVDAPSPSGGLPVRVRQGAKAKVRR